MRQQDFNNNVNYDCKLHIYLVSISQPTRVFGLFLSGFLSEKIGRKKTLIIAAVLQIVSASSVYFCDCFETLVVVVGLSNLITCMVQVPSYSLLSGKYF